MVFFANDKYNLKVFERQPELKKFHEWPNPNTALLFGGDIVENEGDQFIYTNSAAQLEPASAKLLQNKFDAEIGLSAISEGYPRINEVSKTKKSDTLINLNQDYRLSTGEDGVSSSEEFSNDASNYHSEDS